MDPLNLELSVLFSTDIVSKHFFFLLQSNEAAAIPVAQPDGAADKVYPQKISTIVDQISALNLLEVHRGLRLNFGGLLCDLVPVAGFFFRQFGKNSICQKIQYPNIRFQKSKNSIFT